MSLLPGMSSFGLILTLPPRQQEPVRALVPGFLGRLGLLDEVESEQLDPEGYQLMVKGYQKEFMNRGINVPVTVNEDALMADAVEYMRSPFMLETREQMRLENAMEYNDMLDDPAEFKELFPPTGQECFFDVKPSWYSLLSNWSFSMKFYNRRTIDFDTPTAPMDTLQKDDLSDELQEFVLLRGYLERHISSRSPEDDIYYYVQQVADPNSRLMPSERVTRYGPALFQQLRLWKDAHKGVLNFLWYFGAALAVGAICTGLFLKWRDYDEYLQDSYTYASTVIDAEMDVEHILGLEDVEEQWGVQFLRKDVPAFMSEEEFAQLVFERIERIEAAEQGLALEPEVPLPPARQRVVDRIDVMLAQDVRPATERELMLQKVVDSTKVFIPTKEWQEVPPGAVCPAGLEYRMDLKTGKNEARLHPDK